MTNTLIIVGIAVGCFMLGSLMTMLIQLAASKSQKNTAQFDAFKEGFTEGMKGAKE